MSWALRRCVEVAGGLADAGHCYRETGWRLCRSGLWAVVVVFETGVGIAKAEAAVEAAVGTSIG